MPTVIFFQSKPFFSCAFPATESARISDIDNKTFFFMIDCLLVKEETKSLISYFFIRNFL